MEREKTLRLPAAFRRALWIILVLALAAAAAFVAWYLSEYRNYNGYTAHIRAAEEPEEAQAFTFPKDPENRVPGFSPAAENDRFALYVRKDTAEIAVADLRTGRTVYSNPQDASSDPVARSGLNQENLKSQFILNYLDANAKEGTPWSSYAKAAANGQVEYFALNGGLRVVYTLSNEKLMLVPRQMDEAWYAILSTTGKKQAAKSYVLDEESGLYIMKSQGVTARHRQQIDADARAAGFTVEDLEAMNALLETEEEEASEALSFEIALEYRLTDEGLEVTLPYKGLVEAGGAQIRSVQLLPFFGAAGAEEKGDLVVPNGSGALIHFNNGKSGNAQYNQNVYDLDLVDADITATQNTQTARMAMFGICREDSSILATCERGSSLANIVADVAGRNNNYNFAYFTFSLRRTDVLVIAGENAIVAEKDLYQVDCKVRYTLLDGKYTGYSGIAAAYRERLIREGKLAPATGEAGDIPFYYDVIGGVKETAHWMGIQYLRVLPMTTFAQAEEIIAELKHEDIANQRVNLQGWMNGGYYHDPVNSIRVLGELGGTKGLSSLLRVAASTGGAVYPDASLQRVTDIAKGFYPSEEASRYYAEGYLVDLGVISPVAMRRTTTLGYAERGFKLLSPKFLSRYAERLADSIGKLGLDTFSLRDLAYEVHSDKRRSNVINREADRDLAVYAFETLAAGGRELMGSGGNDYSFPYLKHIINAPLRATMYPIIDEEIPLWEMILHGSVGYCGNALNLQQSENRTAELLHLVEYGAGAHFTFTWKDAAEMKYTGLNNNYATAFAAWKDEAVAAYRFINGALRAVNGASMTGHVRLGSTLAKTSYSNGVDIYVNSGAEEAAAEGVTVPPMSYLVAGGDAQ